MAERGGTRNSVDFEIPSYYSPKFVVKNESKMFLQIVLKGIVSQDFGGLQMILMDRIVVPDVLLNVFFYFL